MYPPPQDRERVDPVTDWDRVRFRDERSDRRRPRPEVPVWRSRQTWRWLLAGTALLAVVLVVFRQPLAKQFWPDTRIQQLIDQGDAALRAGHLTSDDGRGARQYYEAALALDSDRGEARAGLSRVAGAALAQASMFTRQGRIDEAHAALALANDLQVPRAQATRVAEALREREAGRSEIEPLLLQAQSALAAGRLDGQPDAALPLFQRILQLQPGRVEALEGREDALSDLLQQAQTALKQGRVAEGGEIIATVRGYDPGHVDLPAAQAALARVSEGTVARADQDLRGRRLDSAQQAYQAALVAAPDDARARQGLERTAAAHADVARRQAADFNFDEAEAALRQARELAPQLPAVLEAEQALVRARASKASLDARISAPQRQQRLDRLLAGIAQAEARNDWITPPGESAFDQLRAAQALAPGDARVRQAADRQLPAVRRCFEEEWRSNRVRRAQGCLSAWQTLQPSDPGLGEARRRMAQKWIAVGDERLGAGDVAFATQALDEARALAPRAPGLEEFAERVRRAGATAP